MVTLHCRGHNHNIMCITPTSSDLVRGIQNNLPKDKSSTLKKGGEGLTEVNGREKLGNFARTITDKPKSRQSAGLLALF